MSLLFFKNGKKLASIIAILLSGVLHGQHSKLLNGPMVGYSEMKEVALWVQTTSPASVHFSYSPIGSTLTYDTPKFITTVNNAYTATLVCDQIEPGKTYEYTLFINDTAVSLPYATTFQSQTLWQWRTDPPTFSFAAGSCAYINEPELDRPNEPYGGGYEIFSAIHDKNPDFMLWLGDNMYLREADWYTRTGIFHRYTHSRNVPEMQPLLANVHHYAIWDDHDYGPNNSDRSFREKETTLEAFNHFWGNPAAGHNGNPGTYFSFQWNDCEFFCLDNRYHRSPNYRDDLGAERTMLGEKQLEWLLDQIVSTRSPFVFIPIGGQFINTAEKFENYINIAPEERQAIIDYIYFHDIENVVFISGDRHHSSMTKIEKEGEPTIYEVTVSPLTSGTHSPNEKDYPSGEVIPGTIYSERNFAIFTVEGPRRERVLTIQLFDSSGELVWTQKLASE
jgi:alkaline phosphatase D